MEPFAHAYFGICSHGVFLDYHFENYDHIVAVTYVEADGSETWLPLTRPSGQVGWYSTGRIWAKWAFRANAPFMWDEQLKSGLRDVTAFWAMKNGVPLADARFNVLVKKYDPRTGWQRNFLHNQRKSPGLRPARRSGKMANSLPRSSTSRRFEAILRLVCCLAECIARQKH